MLFIQQMIIPQNPTGAEAYVPIVLQLLFSTGLIGALMFLTHKLGPKRETEEKLKNFSSGIGEDSYERSAAVVKYFIPAMLFVLLDLEVVFFYPYAVNFRALGWSGLSAVLLFVGLFLCGFIYVIKKGALKWND